MEAGRDKGRIHLRSQGSPDHNSRTSSVKGGPTRHRGGPIFQGLRGGASRGQDSLGRSSRSQGEGFLGVGFPAIWDGGGVTEDRGCRVPGPQPQSAQAGPYPSLAPWPRCPPWLQTPACICSAPAACARSSSAAPWCPPAPEPAPRLNPSPPGPIRGEPRSSRGRQPRLCSVVGRPGSTRVERCTNLGPASLTSFPCHQALPPGPAPPRAPPPQAIRPSRPHPATRASRG